MNEVSWWHTTLLSDKTPSTGCGCSLPRWLPNDPFPNEHGNYSPKFLFFIWIEFCSVLTFVYFQRLQDVMCPVSGSQPSRPCTSGCYTYKGTLDVFYKVIRHVSAFMCCFKLCWVAKFHSTLVKGTFIFS